MSAYVRTSGNIQEQVTFQLRADAVISQANPVSGTYYTVLNTTQNCKARDIMVMVTWTVQPSPLRVRITIDGNSVIHSFVNPISATPYILYRSATTEALNEAAQLLTANYAANAHPQEYEGRSIKVEVQTNGGTTSNLDARVKYSVR